LVSVLDGTMRLLHPVMPFITEAVWLRLPWREGDAPSLMVAEWPRPRPDWDDRAAEALVVELQDVIGAVRNLRAEYGVQPAQRVSLRVAGATDAFGRFLRGSARTLADLARIDTLESGGADGDIGAIVVLSTGTEIFVPLAAVVDLE